jgi:hypothetical protein
VSELVTISDEAAGHGAALFRLATDVGELSAELEGIEHRLIRIEMEIIKICKTLGRHRDP